MEQGRLVSRFPRRWKKLVWDAYQNTMPSRPQTPEEEAQLQREKRNLTEVLQRLGERTFKRRTYAWDDGKSWLINALTDHDRVPFHATLGGSGF